MGSKYQEFTDDVAGMGNKTADGTTSSPPPPAAAAADVVAAGNVIGDMQTSISTSNQPVIIIQAPKLKRSFERYPSKAAVILGAIQVYMYNFSSPNTKAFFQLCSPSVF